MFSSITLTIFWIRTEGIFYQLVRRFLVFYTLEFCLNFRPYFLNKGNFWAALEWKVLIKYCLILQLPLHINWKSLIFIFYVHLVSFRILIVKEESYCSFHSMNVWFVDLLYFTTLYSPHKSSLKLFLPY